MADDSQGRERSRGENERRMTYSAALDVLDAMHWYGQTGDWGEGGYPRLFPIQDSRSAGFSTYGVFLRLA